MDTVKTTVYFWLKIVWYAARFAILFGEIRGETFNIVKGLFLNLLAYLGIGALSAQPMEIKGVLYWLLLLVLGRFILGLFYYPANLYVEARKKQDRFAWENITVRIKELEVRREFRGYAIQVKNEKPFDFGLFVCIPYFEIDGVPFEEGTSNLTDDRRRRLGWVETPNIVHSPWSGWIEKDKGDASFYLLHKNPTSKKNYLIQYYEYSETESRLVEKTLPVNEYAVGTITVLLIDFDFGRTGHEYNFEFRMDGDRKPIMKLSEGGVLGYKSPKQ
jgi:hypothetical protein